MQMTRDDQFGFYRNKYTQNPHNWKIIIACGIIYSTGDWILQFKICIKIINFN